MVTKNLINAPSGQGYVKGDMSYKNDIAPYLGLGFAPKINNNWGVFGEVGAFYTGNPSVNLESVGLQEKNGVDNGQVAANREAEKIRNDDKYEWMPVAKLGVSYHW